MTAEADHETTEDDALAIDFDGEITLPVIDVLTGRAFLTGKSGSGKSNSVSVVAEELLKRSHPLMIVDTDGEYYGLKEQFEVLHAGADDECDIRVGPEHAEKLATLALEQHIPIVLDVSGYLDKDEMRELIQSTAHALFTKAKKLRRPFPLIVEEIHEYIPQSGGLDECGQTLIQIAKRGRKHGLGIIGVSQRPANVRKDFITQANWLLWHRLTWDNDTAVVRRVIDTEHADAVADLADGEGFLMADWADDIRRVKLRRKETFDAGATPGLEDIERPDLKSVNGDLVDDLQEISDKQDRYESELERAKRDTERLREEKAEMEGQLETAREVNVQLEGATASVAGTAGDVDADNDSGAPIAAVGEGDGTRGVASIEEISVEAMDVGEIRQHARDQSELIKDLRGETEDLRERVNDLTERAEQAEETVAEQRERIEELEAEAEEYEQLYERRDELEEAIKRAGEALGIDLDGDAEQYREQLRTERERVEELEAEVEKLEASVEAAGAAEGGIGPDQQFMDALELLRHPATKQVVARAGEQSRTNVEHMWDVLFVLADRDEDVDTQLDDIVPLVDVARSSVSDILSRLREHDLVRKEHRQQQTYYSLRRDALELVIEQQAKREELDELREDLAT
jgi:DNA-binding MarR family transcriptional regulator/peptidoglycan hydrolase CwlO-like protein